MEPIKLIVSLTSHTPERMKNLPYFIYHSVLKYNIPGVLVVLTLHEADKQFISQELIEMEKLGYLEFLISEVDLGSNLKYFFTLNGSSVPVITIDDDMIYPPGMIPFFIENAKLHPNAVIARSARVIPSNSSADFADYTKWKEVSPGVNQILSWSEEKDQERQDLSPEGYGGVYYPANVFGILLSNQNEVLTNFKRADDIYLTILERRKKIPVICPYYDEPKTLLGTRPPHSICMMPDNLLMINNLLEKYREEF